MAVRFHLLDAYGEMPPLLRERVTAGLADALPGILARLPLDRVDIVVAPGPWVIPELGTNGQAHGPGRLTITVDPAGPRVSDPELEQRLGALLAHELHHVARARGPGLGRSLGAQLVTEGLAQVFEEECGNPPPFYAVALSPGELAEYGARARVIANATDYDHPAWMFGRRGNAAFPRNGGYSFGYALVKAWLGARRTTAAAMAHAAAEDVLTPWLAGVWNPADAG